MRILILTPNYNPDLGPSAPLFTMLAHRLAKRGHSIKVITAVPHYPSGQVPANYRGKWFWRSEENGVQVIRVSLPSVRRQSMFQRLIQFIVFQVGATLAGLRQQYDVAIVANPALQVWLPFFYLVVLRRKPAIYSVHDLYPEVGIKLGVFKTKSQVAFVSWLERYCLSHSAFIRILSDSFRPGLKDLGVEESKIRLVYDWVDIDLIQPLSCPNSFSQQNNLIGKYVVLYAGNIGLSQGLENLLDAAELLAGEPDIHFMMVGDGSGKETLEKEAKQKQLYNIQFAPFQPRQRLPEVLASANISVVILKHGIGAASLPSKIFSIMASQRPILISVDEDSEAWKLINRAQAGVWVPPENPQKLAETLLSMKNQEDQCKRLGDNGRVWVEQHHSALIAAKQFEEMLISARQSQFN